MFTINKYKPGLENQVYQLIKKVYDEFVAPDYVEEGNQFFYNYIAPSQIAARQQKQINLWVATKDTEIVGMIEIRDNRNISLLFVAKEYQGQGIAKKLFGVALKECVEREPALHKFYVHASPYSIPIYEKLGFTAIDVILEDNGIKYLPMEMKI